MCATPAANGRSTWSGSSPISNARASHWPLLESGKLNMRRKTFEDMTKGCPQLEELRQLRYARDKMRKVKLAVGARRPESHSAVAVQVQDVTHAAEGGAVDILAGGVVALADQA